MIHEPRENLRRAIEASKPQFYLPLDGGGPGDFPIAPTASTLSGLAWSGGSCPYPGAKQTCLRTAGTATCMRFAAAQFPLATDLFSMSVTFRPTLSQTGYPFIIAYHSGNSAYNINLDNWGSLNRLSVGRRSSTGSTSHTAYIGNNAIVPNQWHQVTVTFDTGGCRRYINGRLLDYRDDGAYSPFYGDYAAIAACFGGAFGINALNMDICHVAFWQRMLSTGEVWNLWCAANAIGLPAAIAADDSGLLLRRRRSA